MTYRSRPHGSVSKLSAFADGYRILMTIFALLRDYRPMTFFSGLAGFVTLLGLLGGAEVITGYLKTGLVTRMPLAILSAGLVLLGAVIFLTGFIVSAINRRFAEMADLRAAKKIPAPALPRVTRVWPPLR